jgi:hypothetical protein
LHGPTDWQAQLNLAGEPTPAADSPGPRIMGEMINRAAARPPATAANCGMPCLLLCEAWRAQHSRPRTHVGSLRARLSVLSCLPACHPPASTHGIATCTSAALWPSLSLHTVTRARPLPPLPPLHCICTRSLYDHGRTLQLNAAARTAAVLFCQLCLSALDCRPGSVRRPRRPARPAPQHPQSKSTHASPPTPPSPPKSRPA